MAVELEPLAAQYGLALRKWQLTGRSLLNRFADGRYKFSHRSIMEFLFVQNFIAESADFKPMAWTDQMKRFLMDMIRDNYQRKHDLSKVCFENADLSGWHILGWNGVLRSVPYQNLVNTFGVPPFVGKTYAIGVDEHLVEPPIMFRTVNGTLIGVEAQRHLMKMAVGQGMRDEFLEAEPISNFMAQCCLDLFVNLMWSGPLLTSSRDYDVVTETIDLMNFVKLGGHSDWRLPTVAEAQTIFGRSRVFQDIVARGAWLKSPLEFVPRPLAITAEDRDELSSSAPQSSDAKRSKAVERGALLIVRSLS